MLPSESKLLPNECVQKQQKMQSEAIEKKRNLGSLTLFIFRIQSIF